MIISLIILSIIGFCISLYAYFTEQKIKSDPNYSPACDISDRISCSKPLQSEYSTLFFLSNSLLGIIYYFCMAILAYIDAVNLLFIGSIAAFILTIYLAYLLYFKIKSLCIVCTSLYIVNITMLVFSILAFSGIRL